MAEPNVVVNNPEPPGASREQELIARVQRGQTELFYELVRPYERRVFAAALAILRNEADAEDVAQEAVLKALANIRQFRAEARFSTWLIQITVNEALMRRRRERMAKVEPLDDQREEESGYAPREFADWREIPSEALERKEVREKLAQALATLDPKYREVFMLRDMEQLNIQETAEALGITEGSVKTRLLRARLMLRDLLAGGVEQGLVQPAAFREGKQAMVNRDPVNCETVWQELSNYLEGDVDPMLRSAMDEHFRTCARCVSVLEGTRNVIRLYGDERMMEVPAGFGRRLEKRLALGTRTRSLRWPVWSMWLMPAAALALIILAVPLTTSLEPKIQTRSPHAQPGHNIPPDLQVLVTDDARVFHVAGCTFIHNKATVRTITAQEAEREGYMPCLRCLRKYLEIARTAHGSKEFAVHVAIAAGDGHGGRQ